MKHVKLLPKARHVPSKRAGERSLLHCTLHTGRFRCKILVWIDLVIENSKWNKLQCITPRQDQLGEVHEEPEAQFGWRLGDEHGVENEVGEIGGVLSDFT